jgi:hypothetical protein
MQLFYIIYPTHTVATFIFVHSCQIYPELFSITQYLHFDFDCKIDVQVNNPIGLIPNVIISCQMTFVHVGK